MFVWVVLLLTCVSSHPRLPKDKLSASQVSDDDDDQQEENLDESRGDKAQSRGKDHEEGDDGDADNVEKQDDNGKESRGKQHLEEEVDEEAVWEVVRQVADGAIALFVAMREVEGARMRDDVLSRAATIRKAVAVVEEKSPETVRTHMEKVENRIRELLDGVPVDEARLLNEAAVFADKFAVAEETVRLNSHLDQLEQLLNIDEAVGRKLDFLVQEINRETNTIGSKCSDVNLTRIVVDIKAEIEKIREQIQNIE